MQDLYPHNNVADTPSAVAQLQTALVAAGVALTLHPGGEVRLDHNTAAIPVDDLMLLNLGDSQGGRFLLFDTWEPEVPAYFEPTMRRLAQRHITPIMAHPERCGFVCEDPIDTAEWLADLGVLLQLNSYILLDGHHPAGKKVNPKMRRCAERLLEFDHYSFLATDSHRAMSMDDRVAGVEAARSLLDDETFHRLTHRNPCQLLPE